MDLKLMSLAEPGSLIDLDRCCDIRVFAARLPHQMRTRWSGKPRSRPGTPTRRTPDTCAGQRLNSPDLYGDSQAQSAASVPVTRSTTKAQVTYPGPGTCQPPAPGPIMAHMVIFGVDACIQGLNR